MVILILVILILAVPLQGNIRHSLSEHPVPLTIKYYSIFQLNQFCRKIGFSGLTVIVLSSFWHSVEVQRLDYIIIISFYLLQLLKVLACCGFCYFVHFLLRFCSASVQGSNKGGLHPNPQTSLAQSHFQTLILENNSIKPIV